MDDSSGLVNRREYSRALSRAVAAPPDQPMAVLMLDLDYFTWVNDRFGSGIGDQVLAAIGEPLTAPRPNGVA
jgi:diguanylate cyclase (GGDEF)-like protein